MILCKHLNKWVKKHNYEGFTRLRDFLNSLLVVFYYPRPIPLSGWQKNLHRKKSSSCSRTRKGQLERLVGWKGGQPGIPGKRRWAKQRRTPEGIQKAGSRPRLRRALRPEDFQTWTGCSIVWPGQVMGSSAGVDAEQGSSRCWGQGQALSHRALTGGAVLCLVI